jgi:hypothetical protein
MRATQVPRPPHSTPAPDPTRRPRSRAPARRAAPPARRVAPRAASGHPPESDDEDPLPEGFTPSDLFLMGISLETLIDQRVAQAKQVRT